MSVRQLDQKVRKQLLDNFVSGHYSASWDTTRPKESKVKWPVRWTKGEVKTLAMILLEERYGKPIEMILSLDKRGMDIARELRVTESCISRWRKRLGIIIPKEPHT